VDDRERVPLRNPSEGIIEEAPDAILGVDADGLIRLCNRQAEVLFGYGRAELEGRPIETLIPHRFHARHQGHREGYFEAPKPRAMGAGLDLFAKRKDGSEFAVDVSLTSIDTEGGRLAAAFVRDTTERKRADTQLRQANQDLESFSHTISHDLRAPLRAIRGFSHALMEDMPEKLGPTGADYLARMDRAGASMERLIDDLLEYSRIGRRQVQTRPVDLEATLREVLRPLGAEIARTGARVEVVPPLPLVQAEPELLGQALANFITNALKYVSPGEAPAVAVSCTSLGDWVRINVRDHGLGIDAEHLERIWKPFERLHGKNDYPGTGVGLAIVARAVERMGGRVGVESQPARGSTFWIELRTAEGALP